MMEPDPTYLDDDLNNLLTSFPVVVEEALVEDEESYQMGLCAAAMLLPNPCISTPWQKLYESQDDWAFITTMGFDVETFGYILTSGFAMAWSLNAAGALGLVLHYLNSTMHKISLQQIFAIIPATVSWCITFGLLILLSTLRNMPEGQIHWPKHDEFDELSQLVAQHHPRLTGAFGSIDGLKLPVKTSDDLDIENATFNGWLSEHFGRSLLPISMPLVVGMIPMLLSQFMLHFIQGHQMDTTLLWIQLFHMVLLTFLDAYAPH
ncbi:hypothetical protein F5J12DRAFT_786347 [Pisolithus orientalis]|uniref:uncharacterized protein n=1 Tax=Pisolithus orientalis TaxID=936130 RepID=UPI0022255920|nr:uncharacterized protein F5J12DRAFT_786347 [Pisolithus orientalis]KAI5991706.1 hypothetical protein F5J12DRAFT_786347 [Pisolithus orientalis]